MNIHQHARTTPACRAVIAHRVLILRQPVALVAAAFGISGTTVPKWVRRFQTAGHPGLRDRSSRPHRLRQPTPPAVVDQLVTLRRQRLDGRAIAHQVGGAPATVGRILRRLELHRLGLLDPVVPVIRSEREQPGELIHLDIKKLGRFHRVGHRITGDRSGQSTTRGAGWEYVHVAVDDASRVALAAVLPTERSPDAVGFLEQVVAAYARRGVRVTGVMTDNGSCSVSRAFREACRAHGLRHARTRPYTPRTNGKAERFIRTLLQEWAYAKTYPTSAVRTAALSAWLARYNGERPHGGIGGLTPGARLAMLQPTTC